jgi:hypothetical protein
MYFLTSNCKEKASSPVLERQQYSEENISLTFDLQQKRLFFQSAE